jgi:hypothetical protein
MTGLAGLCFGTVDGKSARIYDKIQKINLAKENIGHIQTLLANVQSLLNEIPDEVKSSLEIGFLSCLSVKGECFDAIVDGKGIAIKSALENILDSIKEAVEK